MSAEIAVFRQECIILMAYVSLENRSFSSKMHHFEGLDGSRVTNIRDGKGIGPFLKSNDAILSHFPERRGYLYFSQRSGKWTIGNLGSFKLASFV